ncbi:LytTR family DNA-binding domain-containing protein [Nostoc sp. CHAB 5834]|nr:LytTR family DNA-binding domain-containing protein [Nostoc sp. CHAB 5834]
MNVVIVEDEKLSSEHLAFLLAKIDKEIQVVSCFDSVKQTVAAFKDGMTVDLLFMDIHLADGNSFDIFTKIKLDTPLVFTTAYDKYAIQAFKQNSIDYLLKPVTLVDLQVALDKYRKHHQKVDTKLIESIAGVYQRINLQYKTRFLVKMGQVIDTVDTNDIHHFETEESLSFLVTTKGHRFQIDYTLDQLETMLAPSDFFRINRKIIIRFQSIDKAMAYFNGRLAITAKRLAGDATIVSRERVAPFKAWLDH